jgi:subtilisin family serine protease
MERQYTVLRTSRSLSTMEPFGPSPAASVNFEVLDHGPPEFKLDSAALTKKQVLDAARDPAVLSIAPTMPTKLIKPFDVVAQAVQPPWGLAAVGANTSTFNGDGVDVAVLDTGIDAAHPAFAGVTLVEKDFSGSGDGDVAGHGSHCAGTIFGRDVAGTRIGVARGIQRALIGKVLGNDGSGSSDWLFAAMQWALNEKAKVISMSLGFDFPGMVTKLVGQGYPSDLATSLALEAYRGNLRMFDAIMDLARARTAFDGGAVVIAAAGNESKREVNPNYEIAVSLPAAANGVVAVGALGKNTQNKYFVADFSNTFPQISAPGVGVLSVKSGGGLVEFSGTSMATPHVAGLVALWWQFVRGAGIPVTASNVVARLLAAAKTGNFKAGVDVEDRGVGIARAP